MVKSLQLRKMVDLDEPGLQNCFSLSGWMKIIESVAVFTCLMLHRIGDGGSQVRDNAHAAHELPYKKGPSCAWPPPPPGSTHAFIRTWRPLKSNSTFTLKCFFCVAAALAVVLREAVQAYSSPCALELDRILLVVSYV